MTRTEFFETVTDWDELIDFCSNEDCDICADVYDESGRDAWIDDWLQENVSHMRWQDIYHFLYDIPNGWDHYRINDYGECEGLDDDDFRAYVEDVAEWMDNGGWWDEEPDDEEAEAPGANGNGDPFDGNEDDGDDEDADKEPPIEDEPFQMDTLFAASSAAVRQINADEIQKAREADSAFTSLLFAV